MSTHLTSEARPTVQLSLRTKLLIVFVALLATALSVFVTLATQLFTEDKLAYVYDLQSTSARALADQSDAGLAVLSAELRLLAAELDAPQKTAEDRAAAARRLFERSPNMLRVRIYGASEDGTMGVQQEFVNPPALANTGVRLRDLAADGGDGGPPLEALLAQPRRLHVANASLLPDAPLMMLATTYGSSSRPRVVAAEVRHERIMRLFDRSPLHEAWLVNEQGQVLAHPDGAMVTARARLGADPIVGEALKAPAAATAVVRTYTVNAKEYLGSFAPVELGGLKVVTRTPKLEALQATNALVDKSLLLGAATFLAALIVSVLFARVLTARLLKLRSATEQVGSGQLDAVALDVGGSDEVAALGRAFEAMVLQLKDTQAQLIHSEKLSAYGQLGAGITHEVKNPLAGIVGLAQAARMKLSGGADADRVVGLLEKIEAQGLRCDDILSRFLRFARADKRSKVLEDMGALVKDVGALVQHQLNVNNVSLKLEVTEDVPKIMMDLSGMQQVLTNLALNAQQAMPHGGQLTIAAGPARDGVEVSIADTGTGMPEAVRRRIFEPFFTTKPPGEGTGLGLSVVHGVVADHGGRITVETAEGEGTTFRIWLPFGVPTKPEATV